MEKNGIDEKKIAEAKEKLACHILPPGQHSADEQLSPWQAAMSESRSGGTDPGVPDMDSFIAADGRVLLTHMTAAGG